MLILELLLVTAFGVAVLYFGGINTYDTKLNMNQGVSAAVIFISLIGSLQPSNPFRQWQWLFRIQLWLAITYNAIMVFIAFQNESDARQLMKLGDESLGVLVTKEMHTYDDNCEFEWINLWDNIDHYYWGHVINWLLAAFLVRDAWILNMWSILDEILELSWQHKLPHFRECWWDHVLLDVLLSNTVAIFVGLYIIKKCNLTTYDWLGRQGTKSFTEWKVFSSHSHFGAVLVIFTVVSINFLDGFFLMNSLWVPPKAWMVVYRLLIWFGMGHMAFRELHNSLTNPSESMQVRFTTFWTLFIETFISIKFLKGCGNIQDEITPWYIWYPWLIVIGGLVLYYMRLKYMK